MATDAAKDTLPSRSDRDGLFDNPAETSTSWTPKPLPSHPHDRAKAHNKLVAIMRCLSKGVFSNEAARLESHGRIMQRLHGGEIDGSAARSLRERRRCKRRREWRCFFGDTLSHRVRERPMAVGGWVILQCRCGLAASALRLSHNKRCRRAKHISVRN